MDARIILAGQTPDLVGAMRQGNALAAETNQMRQQNALASLYQQQGPQIAAGDQNALNALARFDPAASLGVQGARQDMQAQSEQMRMARENARLRAAELASTMDARQAQETAARLERGIAGATQINDPATWDRYMTDNGLPQLAGRFDDRNILIAEAVGVTEALKMGQQQPTFRPATPEEAGRYGAQAGQVGPDGRFYPINPPTGMTLESTPEGGMRLVQGAGVGGAARPLTEGQSRDNVLVTRAVGALEAFEPVADALTSRGELLAERVPFGLGRGAQSERFQLAMQAGQELLAVILRKDTGAAITRDEQEIYGAVFLPQPGDAPAVLQQKALARRRAVEAIQSGMSPDQILAVGRALVAAGDTAGAASVMPGATSQGVSPDAIRSMSLEDITGMDLMSVPADMLPAILERMQELGL